MSQFLINEAPDTIVGALADALDLVDFGILLLDDEMRVRFINRSFAAIWRLPPALMRDRPSVGELIEYAVMSNQRGLPANGLLNHIRQREAEIRAATNEPARIKLNDGRCIMFRCAVASGGGRVLTFVDISREVQLELAEVLERTEAEARFSTETMESQAAYLATLAEAAEESAQRAETSRTLLEKEVAERRQLETKLRALATIDGLTGALNRSEAMSVAQKAFGEARRSGRNLAMIMVDVDHFKTINDRYGHAGGDQALRHLVSVLRGGIREPDFIGRLGGEEFLIGLPNMPPDAAVSIADRLRRRVAEAPLAFGDQQIAMTVSMGAANLLLADASVDPVIIRADAALYRAKSAGRNRVEFDAYTEAA
jgi:diguanylate cyclase (GGDEF)-like protein